MCGIIGYVGKNEASPILIEGLKRLEYRGYDSAGFCTINNNLSIIEKDIGKIHEVEDHQSEAGATLISVFYNHGLEPSIWQLVQYEYLLKYIGVKGYEVRRLFDVDTVVRYPDGKFELVKGGDVLRDYGDGRYVERIKTAAYTGPKIQLT